MISLDSNSSNPIDIEAFKIALPIGIGVASAARLILKAFQLIAITPSNIGFQKIQRHQWHPKITIVRNAVNQHLEVVQTKIRVTEREGFQCRKINRLDHLPPAIRL
ncbi:hypothetical protein BGZ58_004033 [Dissophora ornata]|nr:hypothetical protein BGZ58_004033 [Dissophora ornata]